MSVSKKPRPFWSASVPSVLVVVIGAVLAPLNLNVSVLLNSWGGPSLLGTRPRQLASPVPPDVELEVNLTLDTEKVPCGPVMVPVQVPLPLAVVATAVGAPLFAANVVFGRARTAGSGSENESWWSAATQSFFNGGFNAAFAEIVQLMVAWVGTSVGLPANAAVAPIPNTLVATNAALAAPANLVFNRTWSSPLSFGLVPSGPTAGPFQ